MMLSTRFCLLASGFGLLFSSAASALTLSHRSWAPEFDTKRCKFLI